MKALKLLVVVAILIALLPSCKKDPQVLIAKSWTVTSYKVNGVEQMTANSTSSSFFAPNCNTTFSYTNTSKIKSFTMDFNSNGNFTQTPTAEYTTLDFTATNSNCVLTMMTNIYTSSKSGTYSLSSDGKKITLIVGSTTTVYDILVLKKKSMQWKGTNSGDTEEYSFVN